MKKCVIIQFEARHEEILPSLIHACNLNGYQPTVVLHRGCKRMRGDIFAQTPSLKANIVYLPMSAEGSMQKVDTIVSDPDVEFVIVGSLSRKKVAEWCMACPKPLICVAHNLDQLHENPEFLNVLTSGKAGFMLLAPHVAAELARRHGAQYADRIAVVEPVFWADDIGNQMRDIPTKRRVVIPGAVNARTRDFNGLLRAVTDDKSVAATLRFQIVSGGKGREAFEALVNEAGIGDCFEFSPLNENGQVSHEDYFAALRKSDLLHPLVPSDFNQYRAIKITSSIMTSVGFSIPAVIDRWTRFCYRAPGFFSDMALVDSLQVLSSVDDKAIVGMKNQLAGYRKDALQSGADDLARLVDRLLA